jgi:signal peptidase I
MPDEARVANYQSTILKSICFMGKRANQTNSVKNPALTGQNIDRRDPAVMRAEAFRVAAQRETVEAFVVAFILALLFRAFLAEAFVIPTGSMAPTLMGAHKDVSCSQCGTSFQCGASRERNGTESSLVVVAGVCPNCRYVNPLDLKDNANHATFNGDRILVNKFTYALNDPERWDVLVFKYPGNPKQNYIKRLVGLPNETLTIRHGDVYVRPTGSDETDQMVRKPASTLLSMSHLVYDTDHQSDSLIASGYPSRWQPWREGATAPPSDSWSVERDSDGLTATVAADDRLHWLRYFHRWPTDDQWKMAAQGEKLAEVDPYSSRAITDFYAFDSYVHVRSGYVYQQRPSMIAGGRVERMLNGGYSKGVFTDEYESGEGPEQFGRLAEWGGQDGGRQQVGRDGLHWTGDLIFEVDLETTRDCKEVQLELIKAGVKYHCVIDLATGKATLGIDSGEPQGFVSNVGEQVLSPVADTAVRAGKRHAIRYSNCDDQLLLWVDGDLVDFSTATTFDSRLYRPDSENRPRYSVEHPLDASPAAVAVRGGNATIRNLRIDRDKYYISNNDSNLAMVDYDMNNLWATIGKSLSIKDFQQVFADPSSWNDFQGWASRRRVTFEMGEDQFFPMGDNSPESLDARCWAGWKAQIPLPRGVNEAAWKWSNESFVPRDLLVGKAVVVFWPHSWNAPVPFLPNFKRFRLIR